MQTALLLNCPTSSLVSSGDFSAASASFSPHVTMGVSPPLQDLASIPSSLITSIACRSLPRDPLLEVVIMADGTAAILGVVHHRRIGLAKPLPNRPA
eukprot:6285651-Amphidinium_carterae.1